VKAAETGVCDVEGNCLCSGEREDPDEIFENNSDSGDDDVGALPSFLRNVIFLPLSRSYFFRSRSNLMNPSYFDLPNAVNFYIPVNDKGDAIGAWYIWPPEGPASLESLSSNQTLIVYMHGNSLDRGFSYRISLYKLLTSLGYHIITFDYRAYGDSSPVSLSERTAVEDGKAVFRWLQEMLRPQDRPRLVVWGHSLGTAIATKTLMDLQEDTENLVAGLVLESPFNKMEDELKHFKTVTWTAWILGTDIAEALRLTETEFQTESYLQNVTAPALVLHAEDDKIVPSYLSERLVSTAKAGGKSNIELVLFDRKHSLRHRYIYRAPGISNIVQDFIQKL